ncbi:hypothetical protein HDU80_000045 [Chytriomyces hyalinus]|nr:hypothetical protein HDU80_000045 [Chytriomyces hyalinus]
MADSLQFFSLQQQNSVDDDAVETLSLPVSESRNCRASLLSHDRALSASTAQPASTNITSNEPCASSRRGSQKSLSVMNKKRVLMESVEKVCSKVHVLERDIVSFASKSTFRNEIGSLYASTTISADADKLAQEDQLVASQIRKIKTTIHTLLEYLRKSDPGSTSLRIVKQTMDCVEHDISTFRNCGREKMEILLLDEKKLTQEILAFTDRINACAAEELGAGDDDRVPDGRGAKSAQTAGVLTEVTEFQNYLVRHGGYNGGWDDLSHAAFLKLRQKYGANDSKFLTACASSIPGVGFREVQEHESWYRTFRDLLESKKEAIHAWKEQKKMAAIKTETETIKENENAAAEREKKEYSDLIARQKARQELLEWKERQQRLAFENKLKEEEEHVKNIMEQEKRRMKNSLLLLQERLKDIVSEYSREKAKQEEMQAQLLEQAKRIQKQANAQYCRHEIERLKMRDKEAIAVKKEKERLKQQEELEREQRLQRLRAQVEVSATKDPSRVLRQTKGFENKLAAPAEETAARRFAAVVLPRRHTKHSQLMISSATAAVLEAWRSLKRGMRDSLDKENEGSLRPVVELLTGAQMQGCLMALLPQFLSIDSGNMVVDMFVVSSAVTFLMAIVTLVGSTITQIIEDDSAVERDINLQVKVEFHSMDKWNEAQENIHWKALAWLITRGSKEQTKGEFRMIPYEKEVDNEDSSDEEEDAGVAIPDFNILPVGNRELEIEHNEAKFTVWFDNNNTNTNDTSDPEKKKNVDPLINREPPILIRRVDGEIATLEWMQETLAAITKLYAKEQNSKKRRARYERPEGYSWWKWVQNLRSTRGLSSVALDETQETLLLKDLETFAQDKEFYKRMGLPYRRGYLFSGKPGTGKTSLINAISATYNRDLYYINLQDIKTDNELQSAFSSVPKKSIIVFEDIDAQSGEVHSRERRFALRKVERFKSFKEKEAERKKKKQEADEAKLLEAVVEDKPDGDAEVAEGSPKVKKAKEITFDDIVCDVEDDFSSDFGMGMGGFGSMMGPSLPGGMGFGDLKLGKGSLFSGFTLSMLLNCLDGHMLNEDVIIIMTTNHPEVLDSALIRPGRIDLHLSLGYCTHYQLNRMLQSVMNDTTATIDCTAWPIPEHVIAPCDALRIMILYRSNPSIIPTRLMERAIELLEGKPLTTGIQAGESSMSAEVFPPQIAPAAEKRVVLSPSLPDLAASNVSFAGSTASGSECGSESEIVYSPLAANDKGGLRHRLTSQSAIEF